MKISTVVQRSIAQICLHYLRNASHSRMRIAVLMEHITVMVKNVLTTL
jgi:hypothetical protein